MDGADPRHAAARARHAAEADNPGALATTRFADQGEVGFTIRSVIAFCGFVRRLHVVTDGQSPRALPEILSARPDWRGRVEVVDHRALYAEHADLLPVFSSRSIETMIHRIPGLAERFVYLNDDILVARSLPPEHFFQSGLPVLRGEMRPLPGPLARRLRALIRPGRARAGFKEAQREAARLAGARRAYLLAGHHPHAMRRSTLAAFFEGRPALLRAQAGHRFRSPAQVSPIGLANHLELALGAPHAPARAAGYVRPPKGPRERAAVARTLAALERGELDSFCVQSLDAMGADDRGAVLAALARRYHLEPIAGSAPTPRGEA